MKSGSKPMMRRNFLKKGVTSSTLLAALPLKKLISFRAFFSDSCLKPEPNPSAESQERFLEVVQKYGSELGDIHVDNIQSHPKLRRMHHGCF